MYVTFPSSAERWLWRSRPSSTWTRNSECRRISTNQGIIINYKPALRVSVTLLFMNQIIRWRLYLFDFSRVDDEDHVVDGDARLGDVSGKDLRVETTTGYNQV